MKEGPREVRRAIGITAMHAATAARVHLVAVLTAVDASPNVADDTSLASNVSDPELAIAMLEAAIESIKKRRAEALEQITSTAERKRTIQ